MLTLIFSKLFQRLPRLGRLVLIVEEPKDVIEVATHFFFSSLVVEASISDIKSTTFLKC